MAAVGFTAATAFAAENYNSSKSNTATSIAKVNEEVGNILLRYNIGGAEINKVTNALAVGISEEKLITLLVEVGVGKERVKAALAEFDKLGIASPVRSPVSNGASEDAVAGSAAPVPSAISPAPVNKTVCTQEVRPCSDGSYVSRAGPNCEFAACPKVATPPISTAAIKKCGVNTYRVSNECGAGAFKNAYVQCYDGHEENLGGESSCKSSEVWQKYAQEICANRCSVVTAPQPAPGPKPLPTPVPVPAPTNIGTPIAICSIPDKLTKDYNQLILDLRKAEEVGDPEADASRRNGASKETAEAIVKKITALKLEIERARKECLANTAQRQKSLVSPELHRPPVAIAIDRCQEVSQWENKIAYYQKLAALSDSELKEQTGFSGAEIERILADLPNGLVKVKAQCEDQKSVEARPREAARQIIAEPVKPVAVESGREISDYYKAKIEKITSEKSDKAQIQHLQSLKSEIDELIAKLLGGRKEMEVSEFDNVVSEIKVSRGEIKADDVSVKTTDKKILIDIGDKSVSVAPTGQQVLIQDKNLRVTASEVSIKDNVLRVGNSEVKLAASKVAETLGVEPRSAELKEENSRAVYKLKVAEQRKLFGFIPVRITKTMTADAESSNLLNERLPWYFFLTTR